jgi:hypothetical protein
MLFYYSTGLALLDFASVLCKNRKDTFFIDCYLQREWGEDFPLNSKGCAMKDENEVSNKIETPDPVMEAELASLRNRFIDLVKEFLLKWCDEKIHSVVRERAEKAKALGPTGLHQMKTEYEQFVNQIPSEIDRVLASEKYWPHVRTSGDLSEELKKLHGTLSDGIRDIQGRLGSLLARYKFASVLDSEWGVDNDDRTGHLRFMSEFVFTEEMNTILKKYLELVSQMQTQSKLKTEQKQEKLEEDAKDSWDQA